MYPPSFPQSEPEVGAEPAPAAFELLPPEGGVVVPVHQHAAVLHEALRDLEEEAVRLVGDVRCFRLKSLIATIREAL